MNMPEIPNEIKQQLARVFTKLPKDQHEKALDVLADYGATMYTLGAKEALTYVRDGVDSVQRRDLVTGRP